MKRYLVKETYVATDDVPSLKGYVEEIYFGKNYSKLKHYDSFHPWNNFDVISPECLNEDGYVRECDAKRSKIYRKGSNRNGDYKAKSNFFTRTIEIVAFEY